MANIKERLLRGAQVLGEFWRAGVRCAEGWKSVECSCAEKNDFCKAKLLWINLGLTDGRMIEEGDYGLAYMMTAKEWDATGLTMHFEIPEIGVIKIGAKGQITMTQLGKVTPETLPSILKVLKVFPGSQVTDSVFSK